MRLILTLVHVSEIFKENRGVNFVIDGIKESLPGSQLN